MRTNKKPQKDSLYLALTEPHAKWGVSADYFFFALLAPVPIVVITKNVLLFALIPVLLGVGYMLFQIDHRILQILEHKIFLGSRGFLNFFRGQTSYTTRKKEHFDKKLFVKFQNGLRSLLEHPVDEFIPYCAHVSENVVVTKDGALICALEVEGLDFETIDIEELDAFKDKRNRLWMSLYSPSLSIHYHMIRSRVCDYPEADNLNGFVDKLNGQYKSKIMSEHMFKNRHLVFLVFKPSLSLQDISETFRKLKNWLFNKPEAEKEHNESLEENIAKLQAISNSVQTSLKRYGAKTLSTYEDGKGILKSELLEALYYLINHTHQPIAIQNARISNYICNKKPSFGWNTFNLQGNQEEDKLYGACISVASYCKKTSAGMMDELMRLPHEIVVSQTFSYLNKEASTKAIEAVEGDMELVESKAFTLQDELVEATDDAYSKEVVYGKSIITIIAKGNTTSELQDSITAIEDELRNIGLTAVRENLNLEIAFWSTLPGNRKFHVGEVPIHSKNFAAFASLHNFPSGKLKNNHWGDALTMLQTTSSTPYYMNLHDRDIGHFTLNGPTGSGKTVLMLFLLAMAQKFQPKTIIFDKDRGAEIFVRAAGGEYGVIQAGKPTGFNPLLCDDTPENRAFLRSWVGALLKPVDNSELSALELDIISTAVERNFKVDKRNRTLTQFSKLLEGKTKKGPDSLSARVKQWYGDGERAWLFDNPEDTVQMNANMVGFDLTSVLDDPISRTPTILYMFHRVEQILDGNNRTMIFVDEGWKALDDEAFTQKLKDWFKTLRKQNGLVGFGSQSITDVINSKISETIKQQCPTNILLPNPKANFEEYKAFGITEHEVSLIKSMDNHHFLIKHGLHSVVAKLDLSGMDALLDILSGRTESVELLDQIRAQTSNDPKDWLPIFEKEMMELRETKRAA